MIDMTITEPYRAALNPLWTRRLRGVVTATEQLTPNATRIAIRTNKPLPAHRAGQHVILGVEVNGVRLHRTYSLTSAARSGTRDIEIAVQRVRDGRVSAHITTSLRVGDIVDIDGPHGDFFLPDADPAGATQPILLLTGGSGITPAISMLRTLEARAKSGHGVADAVLLHHTPDSGSTIFRDEIDRLGRSGAAIRTSITDTGIDGRLTLERLDALCLDWRQRITYVCGPATLIEFAIDHWEHHGDTEFLHIEHFTPVVATGSETLGAGATAHCGRSGVDVQPLDAETLLESIERSGVLAPSGCRNGICHTCTTRLDEGTTLNLRTGVTNQPGEHIQLCVSRALTPISIDL